MQTSTLSYLLGADASSIGLLATYYQRDSPQRYGCLATGCSLPVSYHLGHFPGVDTSIFDSAIVGAGYVVANGEVDIADRSSGFHERRDTPNLISPNGYVSVKTQKFTNAPYNVYLLEQELFVKDLLTPEIA